MLSFASQTRSVRSARPQRCAAVLEKAADAVKGAVNGAPKLNIAEDVTALIGV